PPSATTAAASTPTATQSGLTFRGEGTGMGPSEVLMSVFLDSMFGSGRRAPAQVTPNSNGAAGRRCTARGQRFVACVTRRKGRRKGRAAGTLTSQVGREQPLQVLLRHAAPARQVLHLILADLADVEIG